MPQYRLLTPEQRADHVEALALLGRLVVQLPCAHAVARSFVVMTVPPGEIEADTAIS